MMNITLSMNEICFVLGTLFIGELCVASALCTRDAQKKKSRSESLVGWLVFFAVASFLLGFVIPALAASGPDDTARRFVLELGPYMRLMLVPVAICAATFRRGENEAKKV